MICLAIVIPFYSQPHCTLFLYVFVLVEEFRVCFVELLHDRFTFVEKSRVKLRAKEIFSRYCYSFGSFAK